MWQINARFATSCYGGTYKSSIFDRFGDFFRKPLSTGSFTFQMKLKNLKTKPYIYGRRPIVLHMELLYCARSITYHWPVFDNFRQRNINLFKGISRNQWFLKNLSKVVCLPYPCCPMCGKRAMSQYIHKTVRFMGPGAAPARQRSYNMQCPSYRIWRAGSNAISLHCMAMQSRAV